MNRADRLKMMQEAAIASDLQDTREQVKKMTMTVIQNAEPTQAETITRLATLLTIANQRIEEQAAEIARLQQARRRHKSSN